MAIEAALVTPLVTLMLFGIIEFSFLTRDQASIEHAVRSGARMASTAAGSGPGVCPTHTDAPPCTPESSPALAQLAADTIQRTALGLPEDAVDEILVYKANAQGYPGPDGSTTMPAACAGVSDCVVFSWSSETDAFTYQGGSWASSSISACFPGSGARPLDRVGVNLAGSHDMMTGLFGVTRGISARAVVTFEPLPNQYCAAGEHP